MDKNEQCVCNNRFYVDGVLQKCTHTHHAHAIGINQSLIRIRYISILFSFCTVFRLITTYGQRLCACSAYLRIWPCALTRFAVHIVYGKEQKFDADRGHFDLLRIFFENHCMQLPFRTFFLCYKFLLVPASGNYSSNWRLGLDSASRHHCKF